MSLAQIQSLPATPDEFIGWSFAHMAHHRDIIRVTFEQQQKVLSEYYLDNFSQWTTENTNWLYFHQIMHQQMDDALGIKGFALNNLDWHDDSVVANWFSQNADEHYQAAQILGIS